MNGRNCHVASQSVSKRWGQAGAAIRQVYRCPAQHEGGRFFYLERVSTDLVQKCRRVPYSYLESSKVAGVSVPQGFVRGEGGAGYGDGFAGGFGLLGGV